MDHHDPSKRMLKKKFAKAVTETASTFSDRLLNHIGGVERPVINMRLHGAILDDDASDDDAEGIGASLVADIINQIARKAIVYACCDRAPDAKVSLKDVGGQQRLVQAMREQIRSLSVRSSQIRIIVSPTILTILEDHPDFVRVSHDATSNMSLIGLFDDCQVLVERYANGSAPIIIGHDWFLWHAKNKVNCEPESVDPNTLLPMIRLRHDYTISIIKENYRLIEPEVWSMGFL